MRFQEESLLFRSCCYLEIVTLNDEVPVLVPLDLGLGFAVHLALELNVSLDHGYLVLGPTPKPGLDQDLEVGRGVQGVLGVLGPALVRAPVPDLDVADLQGSGADLGKPGVQVAQVDGGAVLEPGQAGGGAGVGGAVQRDGGALLGLGVGRDGDEIGGAGLAGGV